VRFRETSASQSECSFLKSTVDRICQFMHISIGNQQSGDDFLLLSKPDQKGTYRQPVSHLDEIVSPNFSKYL
jgi:hypothetical protein